MTETPGAPTSWSDRYLAYVFQSKIYLVDVLGTKRPIQVGPPNGNSYSAEFSPEGNYIAFDSNSSGRLEVYVQTVSGRPATTQVSINGGGKPRWRGDGKEIFFVSLDGDLMAADIKLGDTLAVGIPHKLFRFDSRDGYDAGANGYDVTRNGQRFLIVSPVEKADSPITVVLNWWVEMEKQRED